MWFRIPLINDSSFVSANQSVSANRKDLEGLHGKLEAILSIVRKYKDHGGLRGLDHRIEMFTECAGS
jgi:hypothetical protein